jgi:hypothetical protein
MLADEVNSILQERRVRTTRIGGGLGGATVSVSDLLRAVRERMNSDVSESELDAAVKRLGGQRTNFADTAGFLWRLRRFFGQSTERPNDVYAFPSSVVPPPYDEPY